MSEDLDIVYFHPPQIDPVVEDVRAMLHARSIVGIRKYGCTTAGNPLPLREWLQHALEECLDQAVYLRRAIAEIEKGGND